MTKTHCGIVSLETFGFLQKSKEAEGAVSWTESAPPPEPAGFFTCLGLPA